MQRDIAKTVLMFTVPGYWKNEEWIGLPPADSTKISDAKAIVVGWK